MRILYAVLFVGFLATTIFGPIRNDHFMTWIGGVCFGTMGIVFLERKWRHGD